MGCVYSQESVRVYHRHKIKRAMYTHQLQNVQVKHKLNLASGYGKAVRFDLII